MPITDFEQVWSKPDDLPSELAMFNDDNINSKKSESGGSIKSEKLGKSEKGEKRPLPELQMEQKPSAMAVFNP